MVVFGIDIVALSLNGLTPGLNSGKRKSTTILKMTRKYYKDSKIWDGGFVLSGNAL